MRVEDIRQRAEEVLSLLPAWPPVDPFALADRLSYVVEVDPTIPVEAATIVVLGVVVIRLRPFRQPTRLRFNLGHEMGHVLLAQRTAAATWVCDSFCPEYDSGAEWEASRFASELLMPACFLETLVANGLSFKEIRARLDVSRQALTGRLRELGLPLA